MFFTTLPSHTRQPSPSRLSVKKGVGGKGRVCVLGEMGNTHRREAKSEREDRKEAGKQQRQASDLCKSQSWTSDNHTRSHTPVMMTPLASLEGGSTRASLYRGCSRSNSSSRLVCDGCCLCVCYLLL